MIGASGPTALASGTVGGKGSNVSGSGCSVPPSEGAGDAELTALPATGAGGEGAAGSAGARAAGLCLARTTVPQCLQRRVLVGQSLGSRRTFLQPGQGACTTGAIAQTSGRTAMPGQALAYPGPPHFCLPNH